MGEKQKRNYVFHNPNTPEETEKFLVKWLVEINLPKVERMMSEQALKNEKWEEKVLVLEI
ncbi:MAG: hypothetical protein PHY47_10535 [Lachnospiraceae bacterium]|nr:hypothetical protein [Lachnospiraceae bacterium]